MHIIRAYTEDQEYPGPDYVYYSAAVMHISDNGAFCSAYGLWALDPKEAAEIVLARVIPERFNEGAVYVNIWSAGHGMYHEIATKPRPITMRAEAPTIKLTED